MLFHKHVSDITDFNLRYTCGTAQFAFVEYIVLKSGNSYGVSVKRRGEDPDNRVEFEVSQEAVYHLLEIINRYKADRWDGFNKSNRHVLDGNSFSLSIKCTDGRSISAQGYMSYPSGYADFRKEVDNLFETWYRGIDR